MDPAALVTGTATVTVDLHPSSAGDAPTAVSSALARRLLTWCPDLGGVLLAAGEPDLSTAGGVGTVRPLSGFVRVIAAAPVTLFRPRPGARLPATVSRVGADYVGLHVLGAISGAVPAARLTRVFSPPRGDSAAWVSTADPSHTLTEGTPVLFRVVRVRSDGGYCSLVGALDVEGTGEVSVALAAMPPGVGDGPPASAKKAARGDRLGASRGVVTKKKKDKGKKKGQ